MFRVHTAGPRKAADFLSLVDPKVLRGNGIDVVFVYTKNITKEQVKAYHDAGCSVVLIHQRGYEGKLPNSSAYGRKHAAEANAKAAELGYPKDCPIVFASMGDYDNSGVITNSSVAYFDAVRAVCEWPVGAYGDWDLLDRIGDRSVLNVQNAAKGWSWDWLLNKWRGPHRTAHMVQAPSSVLNPKPSVEWPGSRVDFNDILRPIRGWYPVAPKPKPPAPVVVVPKSSLKLTWPRMRNSDVQALNNLLRFFGWAKVSGNVFDAATKAGVVRMQKALKVPADGWYGPKTRPALEAFLKALSKL